MSQLTIDEANEVADAVFSCFERSGVDTENHCDIAAEVVCVLLRERGFDAEVVLGEFFYDSHFWVACDGLILDATIDQFDDSRPRVCLAAESTSRDTYFPLPHRIAPKPVATTSVAAALPRLASQYISAASLYQALSDLLAAEASGRRKAA